MRPYYMGFGKTRIGISSNQGGVVFRLSYMAIKNIFNGNMRGIAALLYRQNFGERFFNSRGRGVNRAFVRVADHQNHHRLFRFWPPEQGIEKLHRVGCVGQAA